jgi:hypothetical protein
MDMDDQTPEAVKAPLEAPVRPRAWAWKDEPSGIEIYSGWDEPRPTNGSEPLYDHAAIDAAVTAERTRIAEAMRNIVRVLHLPDAPQYLLDERHTEKRMLLALADATVADSWPNVLVTGRGTHDPGRDTAVRAPVDLMLGPGGRSEEP